MSDFLNLPDIDEQLVPVSPEERRCLLVRLEQEVKNIPQNRLLSRTFLVRIVRDVIAELGFSEKYVAWGMVMLGSGFWKRQIRTIPFERRVLLLPHCMRDKENCPARYAETGLQCQRCGACDLSGLARLAEELGYKKILVAEGTPVVVRWILNGEADAMLGIGCLKSLERAFEKLQWVGIPAMAVPLDFGTCVDTQVDLEQARRMIETAYVPSEETVKSQHVSLLRGTANLFRGNNLEMFLPRKRSEQLRYHADTDPIAVTEMLGHDYLRRGGKCLRPFITLSVYNAVRQCETFDHIPDPVKKVAMAIEIFHKASLIHDDIEDDDPWRYGERSIHVEFDVPTAINTGDYLLGVGYRLIAGQRRELGGDTVADILWKLGDAHAKLSEGQGAELICSFAKNREIRPLEVLKMYALKTSPAFEAALYAGLRMAGSVSPEMEATLNRLARDLGIAFQVKNDLDDWVAEQENKRFVGNDLSGTKPTLLSAFARETLKPKQCDLLSALMERHAGASEGEKQDIREKIGSLYLQADVFGKATQLIEQNRIRVAQTLNCVKNESLRETLEHLADMILR